MDALATWLEGHKEQLVTVAVQQLSTQELLRQEAAGPVRWFFDHLIHAIADGQHEKMETLLRGWVTMSAIPIDGHVVGLLPVLGVFKRAIWQVFQADPPSESPLALMSRLDGIMSDAAEFMSKTEAAALLDAASHWLIARPAANTAQSSGVQNSFVTIAAHELKTPLTVVEGYANMLRQELSETTHPRAAIMVKGIQTGVGRLRELIEDMIEVSLIDSDLLTLDMQPVWLLRMIDIAVSEVREATSLRHLTLEVQSDSIPARPTSGDPERLLKAFQKVLANAIKYTPDGGKITVSGHERPDYVDIQVRDTGIGIAPENLERIFEKFSEQGDPTLHSSGKVKFKGGGAGLGLAIAKGLLEAHGGTIWAESPGLDEAQHPGSCFHLMIPLRNVAAGEGMSPLVATAASTLSRNLPGKPISVERPPVETPQPVSAPGVTKAVQEVGEAREGAEKEMGEGKDQPVTDTVLPS